MGKRELLIAIVFVAVAAAVYQVTATPAPNGQGFSLSRFWSQVRRSMPDRGSASTTSSQSIPVAPSVTSVRVSEITGAVAVVGETRDDIAADFSVRSTGPDDAQALACAKSARLKADTVGDTLGVSAVFVRECRNVGSLTLKVPRRLAARLEGGSGLRVSDVRALHVMGGTGGAILARIPGAISGDLRAGTVQIEDSGPIDLTLNSTQATIAKVRGTLRLDVRSGRCKATDVSAGVEIEERQAEIDLDAIQGTVRVGGMGGHVRILAPQGEVHVDVRRAGIAAEVSRAVPLSLTTTDGGIDLRLADGLGVDLDAAATDGDIIASEWQLTPTHGDHDAHLAHTWGKAALVSLRVSRGDITIKKIGR
jgi:hypothetical protein